ncbi:DUF1707 domain-containing protein [Tessaracoccus sp. ZS01]|uniref:DUF1707 SHOCT-like domain-containing protein n=1 Tax=Tessaracoccus sp. ZS01 TaxID=1906324 RepID=UPI00096D9E2F|nr:DUF1707 domain-containing protein [Tessaracoccus sp. ZS01]MCG6568532.1 DUF1707 domain-containing protein [Tessaracoccus sp. ZS01]OMG52289.1 hypothetical protein BJN44_13005 [Tessaracoccus sp. ZS01]
MDNLQLRIGDLERNEAVGFLQTHAEQGRLSSEEFNERIGNALTARTLGELASLFSDLPAPKPGPASSLPAVPSPAPLPHALSRRAAIAVPMRAFFMCGSSSQH